MNTLSYLFCSKLKDGEMDNYPHSNLPLKPTNISFLNEYEAVFAFSTEYDANRIAVSLQKIVSWVSFNVEVSCTVAGPDQLVNINRGQTGSEPSLNAEGKDFHTPDHQQIDHPLEQAIQ